MKRYLLAVTLMALLCDYSFSQGVGIGTATPDASSVFDITHTSKGLLIPRMNTSSIQSIANPARGLMVYDSVTNRLMVNTGTPVDQAAQKAGYDFSGVERPKSENDLYTLRYSEFVVPLVKAVQEQQGIIEELKKQNADLQKRVLALEKK